MASILALNSSSPSSKAQGSQPAGAGSSYFCQLLVLYLLQEFLHIRFTTTSVCKTPNVDIEAEDPMSMILCSPLGNGRER